MSARQEIKELEKKIAELKSGIPTRKVGGLTVRVGEKGGLVIYGLNRYPINLYLNQIPKLNALLNSPELGQFITENMDKFSTKE